MNECTRNAYQVLGGEGGRGGEGRGEGSDQPRLFSYQCTQSHSTNTRLHPTQNAHLTHNPIHVSYVICVHAVQSPLNSLSHSRQLAMVLFPIIS